jgi:hypothetical protein
LGGWVGWLARRKKKKKKKKKKKHNPWNWVCLFFFLVHIRVVGVADGDGVVAAFEAQHKCTSRDDPGIECDGQGPRAGVDKRQPLGRRILVCVQKASGCRHAKLDPRRGGAAVSSRGFVCLFVSLFFQWPAGTIS